MLVPSRLRTASAASRGSSYSMKANPTNDVTKRVKKRGNPWEIWSNIMKIRLTRWVSCNPDFLQRSVVVKGALQVSFGSVLCEITNVDFTRDFVTTRHVSDLVHLHKSCWASNLRQSVESKRNKKDNLRSDKVISVFVYWHQSIYLLTRR